MAVGSKLSDFKSSLTEVARPNRFLVDIITAPPGLFTEQMIYHVKSASIPGRTIGQIGNLFWMGTNCKLAGEPTYDDYTITFINDLDFTARDWMLDWLDIIADVTTNKRKEHIDYKGVIKLQQLGRAHEVIAEYYMHGVFPKAVDAIELSTETVDTAEEFSCTFSVDYWSGAEVSGEGSGIVTQGSPA